MSTAAEYDIVYARGTAMGEIRITIMRNSFVRVGDRGGTGNYIIYNNQTFLFEIQRAGDFSFFFLYSRNIPRRRSDADFTFDSTLISFSVFWLHITPRYPDHHKTRGPPSSATRIRILRDHRT